MIRVGCLALTLILSLAAFAHGKSPQRINMLPIADQTYGVAPFQVIAVATPSYLPVTITVQGPAILNGRWLTITGVGTVTIHARQSGNEDYARASAEQHFSVLPGVPSIQVQAATTVYGTPFDSSIFSASVSAVPAADPSDDVPTVTYALDTSPTTGESAADVTVPYDSPALRYEAAEMVETTTAIGLKALVPDPTEIADLRAKVAFTCDCKQFEFVVAAYGSAYRLWVDGSWATTDSISIVPAYPRSVFYNVAFPDKRPRQIKIEFTYTMPFYGLNVSAPDTISAPQAPIGKRVIIFGDSWTAPTIVEPVAGPYQSGMNGSGYGQVLGEYFNWDWWENGAGGTGFVDPGADGVPWPQRALSDLCGRNPDRVVVFGGINDGSYPEEQIQSAAVLFLDELHDCLPATRIYLLGPQGLEANTATAMAAAAALYPETVTYNSAPQYWIYGNPGDPSSGNSYLYFNGHPTPLGHDYLAEQVALSILAVDPSLAPQTFFLFAPAPANGAFTYSVTENSILPAGEQQVSVTFTPQDNVNYESVTQPVSLTVTQASSTLSLSSSALSLQPGVALTLTANVSPEIGGTPSGTVVFTDKGRMIGSSVLSTAGVAVFTASSLAQGQHSISAAYSGDQNFLGSLAGSPLIITVQSPDFSFALSPNQVSVARGESQSVLVTAIPVAGLTAMLDLTCSGLPANASCSLENEQQVALSAGGASAELTIEASVPNKKTAALKGFGGLATPVSCAGVLFFALVARKRRIRLGLFLFMCLLVITGSSMTGCGTEFAFKLPAQGNYAVAVTLTNAADPSMNHTEMLNVTIR